MKPQKVRIGFGSTEAHFSRLVTPLQAGSLRLRDDGSPHSPGLIPSAHHLAASSKSFSHRGFAQVSFPFHYQRICADGRGTLRLIAGAVELDFRSLQRLLAIP